MRAGIVLAVVLVVAGGCDGGGPKKGDQYVASEGVKVHLDAKHFRDAVVLEEAGTEPDFGLEFAALHETWDQLPEGSKFRIVQNVKGGAKVAVLSGRLEGRLGWIRDSQFKKARKL